MEAGVDGIIVAVLMGIVLSPALLLLVWAFFTKSNIVKRRLLKGFVVIAVVPPLQGLQYAFFKQICEEGHIDQPFGRCGLFPNWLANYAGMLIFAFMVVFAGNHVLRAGLAEYTGWKQRKRDKDNIE